MTVAEHLASDRSQSTCWICGGASTLLPAYAPFALYRCRDCEFVFQPTVQHAEVAAMYGAGYFERRPYTLLERQRRHEARLRLRLIRDFVAPPGRLLEVGSATGFFLAEAQAQGWDAVGIEPCDEVAAAAATRLAVSVRTGMLEDLELEPGSYDVACGWHVLEHMIDPLGAAHQLHRALRPGGYVAFEVPNFGGMHSQRQGLAWQSLVPAHHVGQFSPRSLEALLTKAGFVIASMTTVPGLVYRQRREALRPRQLLRSARYAVATRSTGMGSHPVKFDLLRALAYRV